MIADVRHFLESRDAFEPFTTVTSSGSRHQVAKADHANISPQDSRVVVWFDDGSGVIVSALHMAAVEREASQEDKAA